MRKVIKQISSGAIYLTPNEAARWRRHNAKKRGRLARRILGRRVDIIQVVSNGQIEKFYG